MWAAMREVAARATARAAADAEGEAAVTATVKATVAAAAAAVTGEVASATATAVGWEVPVDRGRENPACLAEARCPSRQTRCYAATSPPPLEAPHRHRDTWRAGCLPWCPSG
eukprot:214921-Prymnesium_polylepis.1